MPTLSQSNRVQLGYKLEGVYPTNYGVLQGGNGALVNLTGESLDFTISTDTSKAIRSDRQTTDLIQTGASAQGGFQFEHVYRDMDPLLEGVFQSTYTAYGTAGVSAAIANLTFATGTVTAGAAPTGNDAFTNLRKGQWFTLLPPAGATDQVKAYWAARPLRVSMTTAPTATVITLDSTTPINTTLGGASMAGGRVSSSRMANGTTMRTFSLEVGHLDIGQYRQYLGMSPSKLDLKLASGSIISGSMEFMGKSMTLTAASGMGTPTAASVYTPANAVRGVVDVVEGGALVSAVTYIKSLDLMIDNSLRAQDAVGVFGNAGVGSGTLKVSGKMQLYFADAVHYNKFLNNTASSLAVPVLDPDGNGYVYYIPRMKYNAAKVNAGGLDQDNMLDVDFTGLMDTAAAGVSDTSGQTIVLYRVGA
ncbi:MAG: Dinoroseobacter phage vB DshS-R5C [Pseudomonadota bacterium]|jgi:hypothetical protein